MILYLVNTWKIARIVSGYEMPALWSDITPLPLLLSEPIRSNAVLPFSQGLFLFLKHLLKWIDANQQTKMKATVFPIPDLAWQIISIPKAE